MLPDSFDGWPLPVEARLYIPWVGKNKDPPTIFIHKVAVFAHSSPARHESPPRRAKPSVVVKPGVEAVHQRTEHTQIFRVDTIFFLFFLALAVFFREETGHRGTDKATANLPVDGLQKVQEPRRGSKPVEQILMLFDLCGQIFDLVSLEVE